MDDEFYILKFDCPDLRIQANYAAMSPAAMKVCK